LIHLFAQNPLVVKIIDNPAGFFQLQPPVTASFPARSKFKEPIPSIKETTMYGFLPSGEGGPKRLTAGPGPPYIVQGLTR
jgi:hypothetical protein